jgi:DNA-binding MarR family transcriptional regulator
MTATTEKKRRLLEELSEAISSGQEAVDAFDEAAAAQLGINRTDLRCLAILTREGPLSPSDLATKVDLSRPATTTALDRLSRAGYLRRVRSRVDRRRVVVEITARARRSTSEIWDPLASDGLARASAYRVDQLELILDFLRASRELQERHAARLRTKSTERGRHGPD